MTFPPGVFLVVAFRMKWITLLVPSCYLLTVVLIAVTLGTTAFLPQQQRPLERRDAAYLLETGVPRSLRANGETVGTLCKRGDKGCAVGRRQSWAEMKPGLLLRRLSQGQSRSQDVPQPHRYRYPLSTKNHPRAKQSNGVFDQYYQFTGDLEATEDESVLHKLSRKQRGWVIAGTVIANILLCVSCVTCGAFCGCCRDQFETVRLNLLMSIDNCRGRDPQYRTVCTNLESVNLPCPSYEQYLESRDEFLTGPFELPPCVHGLKAQLCGVSAGDAFFRQITCRHYALSTGHARSFRGTFHRFGLRWFASAKKPIQTIQDAADYIKGGDVQNVVVMAGAGISTPSGIPDFRTPGTGLYDNLQKYNLPYAEAIFDIDYFHQNPKPFFDLAMELYPSGKYRPNYVHYFVRLLHEKGLLRRMYTQNIDGFERLAGIPTGRLIEAHGTFATAKCTVCLQEYQGEDIKSDILDGTIPVCRKSTCRGVIKPDIVFFGEHLPSAFWRFGKDMMQTDLLVVMGTSLEVHPFAGIADATPPGVPRVLFNMEAAGPFLNNPRQHDVVVPGDLVDSVLSFCQLLGWKDDLQHLFAVCEKKTAD